LQVELKNTDTFPRFSRNPGWKFPGNGSGKSEIIQSILITLIPSWPEV
jgi:hypothetical protein